MKFKFSYFLLLVFLFSCFSGFPEGTKEIMPIAGGAEKLLCDNNFATYNNTADYRLYIHIKEIGEIIYCGFNRSSAQSRNYRIKDPLGNIVVPATAIPASGNGYIGTHPQAVAGPNQIVGTGGYDAFSYTPVTVGDFYIEFSGTVTLQYIDITVASSANTAIVGRVWAKAWQFDTGTGTPSTSNGTYFIYTDDGVVTSMDLNGLQGITFTVACNQVGCPMPLPGTGYTRKSVNGKHVIPQYKIFLNDPDITVYPTGTLGTLSNLTVTWNCNGTATITFDVTKAGDVDILLDINPAPGIQAEDVVISQAVNLGGNSIPWNGLNGLGIQVPNGTTFNITVTYILGLTNFPVHDVEANTNGLIVSLVRPAGGQLLMYWDDTLLTVTTGCVGPEVPPVPVPISNYTGCVGSTGCHIWTSVGSTNPGQCSYGNENTVNTYWYAVYTTYNWPSFIVHRAPGAPQAPTGSLEVCAGDAGITYTTVNEPESSSYTWDYTGTGATFNPANPTGTSATIDFSASATSGQVRVRGWNQNCGDGPWSSTNIVVNPIPQLTNPLDASICSGQNFQITLVSNPAVTTFSWTVDCTAPIVTCPSGKTNLNQIDDPLSVSGLIQGIVNYHITPNSGICAGSMQTIVVTVDPKPNVTSPSTPGENLCSGLSTNINLQSGLTGPFLSWLWEILPGGCTNIQACPTMGTSSPITTPLQLSDNGFPGAATYTITPSYGGCAGDPYPYIVHVLQLPDTQLDNFPPVCLNTPQFTLTGGTPAGAGGIYTMSGIPVTTFDPGTVGVGSYPITYTYTDANNCVNSAGPKNIVVQSLITPGLSGNPTACLGVAETFTTDPGMVSSSYQWSCSPDGTITGASPDTKSITWSTTGIKTVTVTYTDPNGCTTLPANKTVTVNSLPVPSLTGNFNVCVGQTYSYHTDLLMQNYSWAASPGNSITFVGSIATVTWNVISNNEWVEVNYVNANGCTAVTPVRIPVIVNPSPVFIVTGPTSVCAGSASTYKLQGIETGNWTITTGGSISTPANNVNSITVNWVSGFTLAQSTIIVNYTNTLNCAGSTSVTVNIQPLPVTSFTTTTPSPVCQEFPTPSLYTVDPGGAASTYTWQVTPAANASIANPNSNPASITWQLTGSTPQAVQLSLTATTSATVPACTATSAPIIITINPKPIVSLQSCFDLVTTTNAKPFILKGGTPLGSGGKYYIDGTLVAGSVLNPFTLSQTSHVVSFTYTDVNGCVASATKTIMVNPSNASYSCLNNTFTDPRNTDPATNKYPTTLVSINGRTACWMLKNLNWGNTAPSDQPQTDNCILEKYCSTLDNTCVNLGAFYQWDELMQYGSTPGWTKGVCPPGWHVPTSLEWQDLIDANQGDGVAGGALKDVSFNALLSGIYYLNNSWLSFNSGTLNSTIFWTSTQDLTSSDRATARGLNNYNYSVSVYPSSRANAFPARCVQD